MFVGAARSARNAVQHSQPEAGSFPNSNHFPKWAMDQDGVAKYNLAKLENKIFIHQQQLKVQKGHPTKE